MTQDRSENRLRGRHDPPWAPFPPSLRAFTLLEVIIAMGIFFMGIFAILELTSSNLRAADNLRQVPVDMGRLVAELSLTNRLEEGIESGDFGEDYPGFEWEREIHEVGTNGLFQVDVRVHWVKGQRSMESRMSALLFNPDSAVSFSGRGPRR